MAPEGTMRKSNGLTRILAVVGTVLAWFPIAVTVFFSVRGSIGARTFRMDYLMPAELFPVALVGGLLLLWAALRARARRGPIGGSLGLAVALLVGSQTLAVATGLASGEIEPAGWPWVLTLGGIAGYTLAIVALGIGGALLVRDVFKK